MTPEARKWLDDLDNLLAAGSTDTTADIMAVLTALRGPDTDGRSAKRNATIPIRRAAFPKTAAKVWADVQVGINSGRHMSMGADDSPMEVRLIEDDEYEHFNRHAEIAAKALGLSVGDDLTDEGDD